jgi:regulator of sirC expression with transglutaminase-like and TPR domain
MSEQMNLTLFAHVCARPEPELDLAEAALLIAETEYPSLDVAAYVRTLDEIGRGARTAVSQAISNMDEARLERAVRYVYEDCGFSGNNDDYYDPRNSFLNDVIDRRTGIPITLAVVLTEICRRAGVDVRGVSFPGHFLVRADMPRGTILVDPFAGRPLTREELRALYARATGEDRDPPPRILEPAPKLQVLARILNNLRSIYENRHDDERLRGVLERLHVVDPSDELRQKIEELGGGTPWPGGVAPRRTGVVN